MLYKPFKGIKALHFTQGNRDYTYSRPPGRARNYFLLRCVLKVGHYHDLNVKAPKEKFKLQYYYINVGGNMHLQLFHIYKFTLKAQRKKVLNKTKLGPIA